MTDEWNYQLADDGRLKPGRCPECGETPDVINAVARYGAQFVRHANGVLPDDEWFIELLTASCGHCGAVLIGGDDGDGDGDDDEPTPDGGRVADADETADDDGRPDDCKCSGSRLERENGLPCWPCYRDGFETPNPAAWGSGE